MTTHTIWNGGLAFDSTFDGHTISLNGATGEDGLRLGFGPKALLLSGLAGCSGIDVVDILNKMKVPFEALEIVAEADQTDEHPKVFKEINIVYRIKTATENEGKIQRAVDLSLQKYCGVAAMLSKHTDIISKIEIL
ncbi:MAG: OsmC family protein [Chitinophagaceae bacterium]|jgi:putative redox protein|nr:OsmC family protein [Chitinophagaceae bacterium]